MANSAATTENSISTVQNSACTMLQMILLAGSRCGEGHSRPYRALRHCLQESKLAFNVDKVSSPTTNWV
jgi:hypothetical protein